MKKIAIIGGGISGLAVLHYLKKYLGDGAEITLYEREAQVGGTIRSFKKDASLFEWGPNGFLDNQPLSLELIDHLDLTEELIAADPKARRRYIQLKGRLVALPSNPLDFIQTSLMSFNEKWALIAGIFKKGISTDCSIHDYVTKRFSSEIAESLVDPFISGIYAGDIKRLHMASAFPKLGGNGRKKSVMRSFKRGMGQIVEALYQRYHKNIRLSSEVLLSDVDANIRIVATPAFAAARIVEGANPALARLLNEMPYAPIAVAGLLFKSDSFKDLPDGFGYLIPSREKRDVLGVLIESNVYAGRAGNDHVMMRVMMGGAHHPSIINDDPDHLLAKAIAEIDSVFGLRANPVETFVKQWPKAIPQYELKYPSWRKAVAAESDRTPGLYLCANYLDGISFNDCVKNAHTLARLLSS